VAERHELGGSRHCQAKHTTARLELGEGTTASAHFGSVDEQGLATKAERRLSGAPTFWPNKRAKRNPLTDYSECAKRSSDCFDSELAICSVLRQRVLHPFVSALTFDMRGAQKAQPFGHPLDGRVRRHVARMHEILVAGAASSRIDGWKDTAMTTQEYEFDVAISFGAKDEEFANRLHDLLEGRLTVFVYSKQQEMLAGTDGEQRFNEVFGKLAKLVVVLHREAWGKTPFTRFEETAIRNRAFSEGYDFTIFVPMDDAERQKVPQWLPKNRLYVGLERWGIEGAAAAIEARFSEMGGTVREETIDDIAVKAARVLEFKKRRDAHLSSDAGVIAQREAYEIVRTGLLEAAEKFKKSLPGIKLSEKHGANAGGAILFLSDPVAMSVTFQLRYANTLTDAHLDASLWRGHPPWPGIMSFEEPQKLSTLRFNPDLTVEGQAGWKHTQSQKGSIASKAATDEILKFFLAKVQGR
jgi:hypothetical protein